MPNLLEETRNLMPGRAKSNWSLTEARKAESVDEAIKVDPESVASLAQRIKPGTKLRLRRLAIYATSVGTTERETVKVVKEAKLDGDKLKLKFEKTKVKYGDTSVFRPFTLRVSRMHGFEVTSIGVGKPLRYELVDVDGKSPFGESVAGAPGAFAISDAEPPSLEAMKADLIDRVRSPRWEYPSWALPKVKLDEESVLANVLGEATGSPVLKTIRNKILVDAEEKLNAHGKHYGAKVSITGSSHGLQVRMWIKGPKGEADDVAKTFLGSGYTLEQHKLKKDMWVAKVTYQLGDLF
jgi:hypothetical protein